MAESQTTRACFVASHDALLRRYSTILLFSGGLKFLGASTIPDISSTMSRRARLKLIRQFLSSPQIGWLPSLALRPLIQPFVESHIAQRCFQLECAYLYLSKLEPFDSGELGDWLSGARTDLAQYRLSLSPWNSLKSLSRLLGVPALGLFAALLGGSNLYTGILGAGTSTLVILGVLSFLTAVYAMFFLGAAFSYKRLLFLEGPESMRIGGSERGGLNTYEIEGALWRLIPFAQRRLEPPLDILTFGFVFSVIIAVGAMTYASNPGFAIFSGAVFFVSGLLLTYLKSRGRTWR